MSVNYDNWERLVAAVLRREADREMALADSRDPSIISSSGRTSSASASASAFSTSDLSSFTSYSSRFDHSPSVTRLPMDYTHPKLDHDEWKTMLPPDKPEAVWTSASLSFSLDPGTGKNCFMLGAAKLVGFLPESWEIQSHPKSRFEEVFVPRDSWGFDIRGRINTRMLSPKTLYEVYLVFELADKGTKMEYFARARIANFFHGRELDIYHPGRQAKMVNLFQLSSGRDDGWMEIQLGCFYVGYGLRGEVEARVLDMNCRMNIIVEGIEFRPMKAKNLPTFGFFQHNYYR
ncbi:UNVERIFIED_CONTAM: F-box protein PP2-B10 [Sesamum radiatum]|uniref:F-box protein PP2-B10 n=1 Tax=Sesamum radiatum TaxID=300843 RepID=A0AAW2S745_SESRA